MFMELNKIKKTKYTMAISDVRLKNNYYEIFDGNGKKGRQVHLSVAGELCGFGQDFLVFSRNSNFTIYDENFRKLREIHQASAGAFKSVAGLYVNFLRNNYVVTYDKNFKKVSERHASV